MTSNNTWPFVEARRIADRIRRSGKTDPVVFQTGYGPSGLPHIGTFAEVVRTQMVRNAYHELTGSADTRLIVFSDDRDPFDKVPENVPNRDDMAQYVGRHLSAVPNPFDTEHASFAAFNNWRLTQFLNEMAFPDELGYEFVSSHATYNTGDFDAALLDVLRNYDAIMDIILPSLGEARRATWSPFFPILEDGRILKDVPVTPDAEAGTITYADPETGADVTVPVNGRHVKCQWKVDWAMRWHAFNVDYEMNGKDLMDSYVKSSRICRVLGSEPPANMKFELFLDENGNKLSKSVGRGFDAALWSRYGPKDAMVYYMFQKPNTARNFSHDLMPRIIDDYATALNRYAPGDAKNPVWHVHFGSVPEHRASVPFTMVLNMAAGAAVTDAETLRNLVFQHNPGANTAFMNEMIDFAFNYYRNFVAGKENFKDPDETEREMLAKIISVLDANRDADAKTMMMHVYDVGRSYERWQDHANMTDDGRPGVSRDFFKSLYLLLLGQESGPRFAAFALAFGIDRTIDLIRRRLRP